MGIHQRFSESREDNALDTVVREFLQFTNDFLEKCFVHMLLTVPERTKLPTCLISCGVYAVETLEIAVFRLLNIDGERGSQRDNLRKLLSLGIIVWLDFCHMLSSLLAAFLRRGVMERHTRPFPIP